MNYRHLAIVKVATFMIALGSTPAGIAGDRPARSVGEKPTESSTDKLTLRGHIEPEEGVIAVNGPPETFSSVAIVDKILVKKGSKIEKGQILAVMSGYELSKADLEVSLANLKVAQLQRAQLQAGIGKLSEIAAQSNVLAARRIQMLKTQKDWDRVTRLVQKEAASIQNLDTQKAALDQIIQEVEQAQNAIKALTEVRPVDDALAEG